MMRALRAGDYSAVVRLISARHRTCPYSIEDAAILSSALWQLGDGAALRALCRRCQRLNASSPETWAALGNLCALHDKHDCALTCFRRAARASPQWSYARCLAGHELFAADAHEEAAAEFRRALALNPGEWSAWFGLARLHLQRGATAAAQYEINRAIDCCPESSVLHAWKAEIAPSDAEAALREALSLSPDNTVARCQLAQVLVGEGRAIEAKAVLDAALVGRATSEYTALQAEVAAAAGNAEETVRWNTRAFPGTATSAAVERRLREICDSVVQQSLAKLD